MASPFALGDRSLGMPRCATGKRSRSSSSSGSASPSGSSTSGSSIFSHLHNTDSDDISSSCSSPTSSKTSPASSHSDDERPCKSLRTTVVSVGPVNSQIVDTHSDDADAELATLKSKCTLDQKSSVSAESRSVTPSPPGNGSPGCGVKTLFVDCLVDATVHVLDMIWHAPVHKSIAFLQNVRSASSACSGEIVRPCRCPVGAPFTGGIPLDLFIRETLRRSRTSCSTLQAALLYCKRVGAEAIRKRAEKECVELSEEEKKTLEGHARAYPSLQKSLDKNGEQELPPSIVADPILCSRRTFLAAVMTSSKFLQDRTFSNRAWSKISGLSVNELGLVERRMLDAIEFDLYVGDDEWQSWTNYLKGDWKSGIDACQCQSPSPAESLTQVDFASRKALERTTSLRADAVLDAETTASAVSSLCHRNTISSSATSTVSTPKQMTHGEDVERTPTKAHTHKREQSLLPLALLNSGGLSSHKMGNSDATQQTEMSVPFPMRKGMAVRSMSTQ